MQPLDVRLCKAPGEIEKLLYEICKIEPLTCSRLMKVRVLFFLVTVTVGIVSGFSDLEASIPVALGYSAQDDTRKSLLRHSESRLVSLYLPLGSHFYSTTLRCRHWPEEHLPEHASGSQYTLGVGHRLQLTPGFIATGNFGSEKKASLEPSHQIATLCDSSLEEIPSGG